MREIIIASDVDELSRLAAAKFAALASSAIKQKERFTVALSGGSTPKALFHLLSSDTFNGKIDWDRISFFFGDERNVPPDSEESNFRMADENLFQPLKIKSENIHRWKTEIGKPEAVAADYEAVLHSAFPGGLPIFDLIFLGMGADGHTASLFPHTAGLDEKDRLVTANDVPQLNTIRLTLTYPVINNAANIAFLVAGADKAPVLAKVLEGDGDLHEFPSRGIHTNSGTLYLYLDEAAAKDLSR